MLAPKSKSEKDDPASITEIFLIHKSEKDDPTLPRWRVSLAAMAEDSTMPALSLKEKPASTCSELPQMI